MKGCVLFGEKLPISDAGVTMSESIHDSWKNKRFDKRSKIFQLKKRRLKNRDSRIRDSGGQKQFHEGVNDFRIEYPGSSEKTQFLCSYRCFDTSYVVSSICFLQRSDIDGPKNE